MSESSICHFFMEVVSDNGGGVPEGIRAALGEQGQSVEKNLGEPVGTDVTGKLLPTFPGLSSSMPLTGRDIGQIKKFDGLDCGYLSHVWGWCVQEQVVRIQP